MANVPQTLTLQQRIILDHLRHARGSPLPIERLVAAVYGSRHDGGPENAAAVVKVQICHMRRCLGSHGVRILTIGFGRNAQGYMIDPDHLDLLESVLATLEQIAIEIARSR